MNIRTIALALLLAATPAFAVELKPFVRGSWQQLRKAHEGQPVIVHFWGVTCAPCMEDLPKWGALQRERPRAALIFVASDPVPIEAPQILAAITKTGIGASENWMFADAFGDRLRYEVNPTWGGEMPYTVLIGRDGEMTPISGVTDLKAIRKWLGRQTAETGRPK